MKKYFRLLLSVGGPGFLWYHGVILVCADFFFLLSCISYDLLYSISSADKNTSVHILWKFNLYFGSYTIELKWSQYRNWSCSCEVITTISWSHDECEEVLISVYHQLNDTILIKPISWMIYTYQQCRWEACCCSLHSNCWWKGKKVFTASISF